MPYLRTYLSPELANNAIRLYRECLRCAKSKDIGLECAKSKYNFKDYGASVVETLRWRFKKHMRETDPEKIQKLKEDAATGLINHMLYESDKMSGRKYSQYS